MPFQVTPRRRRARDGSGAGQIRPKSQECPENGPFERCPLGRTDPRHPPQRLRQLGSAIQATATNYRPLIIVLKIHPVRSKRTYENIKPVDVVGVGMWQKHTDQVEQNTRLVREILGKGA